jgi:sugar/nucleoside kinase (ribokinase family)
LLKLSPACKISVDVNSSSQVAAFDPQRFIAIVERFNPSLLTMNEEESSQFTNLSCLVKAVDYLVVHRGVKPSLLWQHGELLEEGLGIIPNLKVIDSTGAGDAFTAGFIAAMCQGKSGRDSLIYGHLAAQRAISQIGGFPASENRAE